MIPLIIVLGIGLIVAVVAGLVLLIPWLGEIIVGALFFLALAAGFVMTLVLIGTAGGFNLMYPTIAVEGSDSFDAISRSFSYVYAKPWRMLFYSAVALAYGAITYLFVRLFIYLTLLLTWFFVGLFVFRHVGSDENLWPALMPRPSFISLPYETNMESLTAAGSLAARSHVWQSLDSSTQTAPSAETCACPSRNVHSHLSLKKIRSVKALCGAASEIFLTLTICGSANAVAQKKSSRK